MFRVSLIGTTDQWRYNYGRLSLYHWRQYILSNYKFFWEDSQSLPSIVDRPIHERRILQARTVSMGYMYGLDIYWALTVGTLSGDSVSCFDKCGQK